MHLHFFDSAVIANSKLDYSLPSTQVNQHVLDNSSTAISYGTLGESGFRNPGNFCLWNLEFGKNLHMESGILRFGKRDTVERIRNLTSDWNPESKFR